MKIVLDVLKAEEAESKTDAEEAQRKKLKEVLRTVSAMQNEGGERAGIQEANNNGDVVECTTGDGETDVRRRDSTDRGSINGMKETEETFRDESGIGNGSADADLCQDASPRHDVTEESVAEERRISVPSLRGNC